MSKKLFESLIIIVAFAVAIAIAYLTQESPLKVFVIIGSVIVLTGVVLTSIAEVFDITSLKEFLSRTEIFDVALLREFFTGQNDQQENDPQEEGAAYRVQFAVIGQLIMQKRYYEARAFLKSIDHPKAREWEAKLDELEQRESLA